MSRSMGRIAGVLVAAAGLAMAGLHAAGQTSKDYYEQGRAALAENRYKDRTSVGEAAKNAGLGAAVVKQWYDAFSSAGRAALK